MHIYVLSRFCKENSDIADPEMMGVFEHRKDAYTKLVATGVTHQRVAGSKLVALINHDEIHNEQAEPTPARKIIQDIKKTDEKEWQYNDYARDWYWRITRHYLE